MTDATHPSSEQSGGRAEWEALEERLGYPGAILSGTKQTPRGREDHTIYWNACVFNQHGQQIWHGDLDVTEREPQLRALAEEIGTVYVTPEHPWRFDGFHEARKDPHARERLIEFTGGTSK